MLAARAKLLAAGDKKHPANAVGRLAIADAADADGPSRGPPI